MSQQPLLPEIQEVIKSLEDCVVRAKKEVEELAAAKKYIKIQIREFNKAIKDLPGNGKGKGGK